MNSLTAAEAITLINEIETATGRYAGRSPERVEVQIDEMGIGYIVACDDPNCLFAKINRGHAAAVFAIRDAKKG